MVKYMKLKKYEKTFLLYFFIYLFLAGILILLFYCFSGKFNNYYAINGVVFGNDIVEVMVTSSELKILYKNGFLYLDDKKKNYDIVKVNKNILKTKNKKYHEVLISLDVDNMKENDILQLVFCDERIKIFEIFKSIWKEDK